ncbi:MAG: Jag N-terminal domain-containing protein [Eubacterium sp.]|jgi:spoIIIJ-associated protein|nr:Jag N-terminal domain-containing protein [Eubacterium sp.]MCH4046873.1 Jag N-terminal domain-containing protein [Eubacterium sp.]MCH4079970.1 Jag N-terminal domain-containing protein [Eubacterium sp.]MCH4109988.1 Jag N-terminal domain-containing protein [Eubacterium sp.]MCI1307558.1 Jag N-terminal domain-containing protein [Eubacterium sp.]
MDVTEKWGDDVDSAVALALADLKCTIDQVDVEVLEQPSRGFFGLGSKLALVRVTKKSEPAAQKEEEPESAPAESEAVREQPQKAEPQAEAEASSVEPEKKHAETEAGSGKPHQQKASGHAKEHHNEHRESSQKRRPDARRRKPAAPAHEELPELNLQDDVKDLPIVEEHPALDFLKDVTSKMGLDLKMTARADETHVHIDISGEDSRTIIGKRGQTLDAIQYLTSLVVNKEHKDYVKVVIDAEHYRSRREKTLEQLAERLARKAVHTGRSIRLEPMNPYERKVIHATLQHDPKVTTRSEGQDPFRRVVIELK